MAIRFNPPPNWPPPPTGWAPPAGWTPPADWPAPPYGWPLWIEEEPQRGLLSRLLARKGSAATSAPASAVVPFQGVQEEHDGHAPQPPQNGQTKPALDCLDVPQAAPSATSSAAAPTTSATHARGTGPIPPSAPAAPEAENRALPAPETPRRARRHAESASAPSTTSAPAPASEPSQATAGPVVFELWGQRGWCGTEVVGESHYISALRSIAGKIKQGQDVEVFAPALLVPDPHNPHDRNAVGVHINGQQVGSLAREEARRYTKVLQALGDAGLVGQVNARVWAGMQHDLEVDRRGNLKEVPRFVASVRIDLAEPHLLVPGNMPPAQAHELLPAGHAIQVSGEDKHVDVLAPYAGRTGEQYVYATLHELVEQLARSTRTVVEVRIDGHRVGQLTPKMSADVLPCIRHLAALGLESAARTLVKGNRAAAEAVVYVQRAHQLDNAWFDAVQAARA